MEEMTSINLICQACLNHNGPCKQYSIEKCCIKRLKYFNPNARAEDIFRYCCIESCGFNKHNCNDCFITDSNVIRFNNVMEVKNGKKAISD